MSVRLLCVALLLFAGCIEEPEDTGSGACPEGVTLSAADVPCSCGRDSVGSLPADTTCFCDATSGLTCDTDTGDSGNPWIED